MYTLNYIELLSSRRHEHYRFLDEHCCTIISARTDVALELVVYHDRKEFAIYHMYDADKPIADDICKCIDENLEFLGAEDYELQEVTNGNCYFVDYIKRKYGVGYENYR